MSTNKLIKENNFEIKQNNEMKELKDHKEVKAIPLPGLFKSLTNNPPKISKVRQFEHKKYGKYI